MNYFNSITISTSWFLTQPAAILQLYFIGQTCSRPTELTNKICDIRGEIIWCSHFKLDNSAPYISIFPTSPPSHQGSNWNSSWLSSQADWVNVIFFSCCKESISPARQLSISTVSTHFIQLNFTFLSLTTLMLARSLLSRMTIPFSWNPICPSRCRRSWLSDWGV